MNRERPATPVARAVQNSAARAVLLQLKEEPEPGDLEAIAEGRAQIERGEFITLEQLEHDLGSDPR